jgi:hypothetical protein
MAQKDSVWSFVHLLAAALIGLAAGRFLFNDTAKIHELQTRLNEADRKLATKVASERGFRAGRTSSGKPTANPQREADPETLLTDEEQALTNDLIARAKDGEYILHYEYPEARKRVRLMMDQMVARRTAGDTLDYGQAFRELGIGAKAAEHLSKHVEKIHRAALEAEGSIQQLLFARREYKQRIQSVLPPEDFQRYEEYEQSKRARRELENIRQFAQRENLSFDPTWEASLVNSISKAQAFTEKVGYGPLDAMPNYSADQKVLVSQIEGDIAAAAGGFQRLSQAIPETGLPSQSQQLLTQYYADRLNQKRKTIEAILNPPKPPHD